MLYKTKLVHSVAKNMNLASEMWKMENLCLVYEAFKRGLGEFIRAKKIKQLSVKLP